MVIIGKIVTKQWVWVGTTGKANGGCRSRGWMSWEVKKRKVMACGEKLFR